MITSQVHTSIPYKVLHHTALDEIDNSRLLLFVILELLSLGPARVQVLVHLNHTLLIGYGTCLHGRQYTSTMHRLNGQRLVLASTC